MLLPFRIGAAAPPKSIPHARQSENVLCRKEPPLSPVTSRPLDPTLWIVFRTIWAVDPPASVMHSARWPWSVLSSNTAPAPPPVIRMPFRLPPWMSLLSNRTLRGPWSSIWVRPFPRNTFSCTRASAPRHASRPTATLLWMTLRVTLMPVVRPCSDIPSVFLLAIVLSSTVPLQKSVNTTGPYSEDLRTFSDAAVSAIIPFSEWTVESDIVHSAFCRLTTANSEHSRLQFSRLAFASSPSTSTPMLVTPLLST
mmetsp:Transcript_106907/g.180496  ORF Transcript_106907/g.180496 Transcript_106907/m.180496 type:complete len:253 (+) Transcript_106907:1224-1982(+)